MIVVRQDLASQARSVASNTCESRLEAVSSGPKTRKLRCCSRYLITSRRYLPRRSRLLRAFVAPGAGRRPRSRGNRAVRRLRIKQPAIGVRVRAHAAVARGRQRGDLRPQARHHRRTVRPADSSCIQSSSMLEMRRLGRHLGQRHLMRAPEVLRFEPVDLLRAGPALGGSQDDHRPARALCSRPCRGPRTGWRGFPG